VGQGAYVADGRKGGQRQKAVTTMTITVNKPDFRRALDGVIGARTREATRQVVRRNEFQLLGGVTKRPS
jgi:hypothetical protein